MSPAFRAVLALIAFVGLSMVTHRPRVRPKPVVLTVAIGTEPFWSVDVYSGFMRLRRPGADSTVHPYSAPEFDADGRAVYRSYRFSADPAFTLVIARGECRNGTSERRYPASAVLTRGDSTWRGCATTVPNPVTRPSGHRGPATRRDMRLPCCSWETAPLGLPGIFLAQAASHAATL